MSTTVHAAQIYDLYAEKLGLQWLAGQAGAQQRALGSSDLQTAGVSLVGYLSNIRPNKIQVAGPEELAQLDSLEPSLRREAVLRVFANRPIAVIVTAGLAAPAEFVGQAELSQTPLLGARADSNQVIQRLRYYLEAELAPKLVQHGVFLEVHGLGILLTGESGIGKSELALELISRGHRLVADDAPEFFRAAPDTITGVCPDMLREFLEVRGLGLLNIRAMFGDNAVKKRKNLHLIINLRPIDLAGVEPLDRLMGSYRTRTLLEVEIPEVTIPVAPGRNLAVLVEAATRQHSLLREGYNAAQDFVRRQRTYLTSDP